MNILFNLSYITSFGEELVLNVIEANGTGIPQHIKMHTNDGENWQCRASVKVANAKDITYYYSVEKNGVLSRHEWLVLPHRLAFASSGADTYNVYDRWIDIPNDSYLYSSAFTECVSSHTKKACRKTNYTKTLRLKVRAPQLRSNERLAILGDDPLLGQWEALKAVEMCEHDANEWVVNIDATRLSRPVIEFKFVALDDEHDVTPMWETGQNRCLIIPEISAGEVVVMELPQAYMPVYPWKGAGTVIPVFSLRSEGSFGVGDFGDLFMMVDWCAATSQRALQILPINDTTITHTWQDSYPYNSISIYALHPQYTDLRQLPPLKDEEQRKHFAALQAELNALPQIDYERVNDAKLSYLRQLYAETGAQTMRKAAFKAFFERNSHWLVPYGAFCHFRDLYGTATFSQWPDHHHLTAKEIADMSNSRTTAYKEVAFWYFVQFNLDQQMRRVHEHAMECKVILKGDIPIGISRDGVEAWVEPRYFNLNGQAGAPPDAFSTNGQNWGFPTYNWDEMLSDGCSWWVKRFSKMAEYFDAYRIDHVLGFFRIWEIPIHSVHGLLGQFSPALAMSRDEIQSYGLYFNEDLYTRPFITDWVLDRMFGQQSQMVKDTYLNPCGDHYEMKAEFDTQRKVEAHFRGATSEEDIAMRDSLYALISDVLFVRDRKDANKFHPRIAVQLDYVYESLHDTDKYNFNRLYNDYFYRRNNQFWYHEAMKKLPLLTEATRMLVCAEDLGMVPDCVPWVMNELRILSLEIQSMPKDSNVRFGHLSQNPYRSVCTISTHDMSTLRQWWDEDWSRTQDYFNSMLHRQGSAPHPLAGWLARDIVSRHLTSPSMLCLLSLQDWMAIDEKLRLPDADAERINIPANPRHYWRYRMHLTIEQLMAADDFNDAIRTLINQSGR